MTTDPNIAIAKYFEEFYSKFIQAADEEAKRFIDSLHLSDLPLESQIVKLSSELLSIRDEIEIFDKKEYIHFASQKQIISNIFSARVLLLGKNEQAIIKQALIISSKKNKVIKLINELKLQLPAFSFSSFLRNEFNVQFYTLHECPNGVSLEDYTRMRNFQTLKKVECVQLETSFFFKVFYSNIDTNNEKSFIDQEIKPIAYIFKNAAEWSHERFFSEIKKLKGIRANDLNQSNDFFQSFKSFSSGNILNEKLSLGYLTESLKQLKGNQHSNPPIFCQALVAYESCLCEIEKGKMTLAGYQRINYENLFEKTYNEGIKLAETKIDLFSSNYELDSITHQKYAEVIINELNKLRTKFKEPDIPDYYNFLHDEESLKTLFFNNCLLAENVESNINALKQAIVINQMFCFLMEEVVKIETISPDYRMSETDFRTILEIFQLQVLVVPFSDILNQLLNALSETLSKLKNPNTPLWFIIEDFKEAICEIYERSYAELEELIKETEPENLEPFITGKLRDLQFRKNTLNTDELTVKECFKSLLNIFKVEKEYLQSIRNLNPIDIDKILNEKPATEKPKLTFGYLKSNPQILYPYIKALSLQIEFLDNPTSVEDFIKIVTVNDLEKVKEKIYLGCATNEFAYVVEKLKPFFKSLKPIIIERSGLFISNFGNPITANNLYNTNFENLHSKTIINQIFNQKQ